jgi:hypothetical protein
MRVETPFGGPGSGLWPSGSAPGSEAAAPEASTCKAANFLSDCFAVCTGIISEADPGPVCGWTFFSGFGDFGGSVAFSPGMMTMLGAGNELPSASRPLFMALSSILDLTIQFTFTEFPIPAGSGSTYFLFLRTVDGKNGISFSMDDSGNVIVQAGPVDNAPNYLGTWTPNGGTHQVQIGIDDSGVPLVWIDGISIPVVLGVVTPSQASVIPENFINLPWFVGLSATAVPSPVFSVFVTSGVYPPSTVFCCP